MANFNDYLREQGTVSLSERPLSALDCLVFSELSYSNYDFSGVLPIPEAMRHGRDGMAMKKCQITRDLLGGSDRFRNGLLSDFVRETNPDEEKQFAAMCVWPGDGTICVVFRGTDSSFVGWKEDFNMIFEDVLPAQAEALRYLNEIAARYGYPLRIMGHSKGGNLAVYAAAFTHASIQKRILDVYSFDGPGQTDAVIASPGYERIQSRIHPYVPEASIIGMLFHAVGEPIVVRAQRFGPFQHNLDMWLVNGAELDLASQTTRTSEYSSKALRRWLSDLSMAERQRYVDALYKLMRSVDVSSFDEIAEKYQRVDRLMGLFRRRERDTETSRALRDMLTSFLHALMDTWRDSEADRPS